MKYRILHLVSFCLVSAMIFVACSSSEELGKDEQGESAEFEQVDDQMEPIMPATNVPSDEVSDEEAADEKNIPVMTDEEIAPAPPARQEMTPPPAAAPQVAPRTGAAMWSVQLGAFRSEAGALELVNQLKQRFNQPVYKNYDAATSLFKVTLGSFQAREQGAAFKEEVQAQGYPDAFTVEVTR